LESIAEQSELPQELVVCDDGSVDGTVAILEAFSATARFPVRIHINERNLGYRKNFEQAISLCTNGIVALSDQDDVWDADKLRLSAAVLRERPGVGLVCTDAEIVDRDLAPQGIRMSDRLGFSAVDQAAVARGAALEVLVRTNFVTGTTLAFRSDFVHDIVPVPECWVHDAWIALVVALRSELAYIDRPLVRYRQHGANQVGAPQRYGLRDLLDRRPASSPPPSHEVVRWRVARERSEAQHSIAAADLALLRAKEQHMRARAELPGPRLARIPSVLRELARSNYRRYSAGPKSAVKDLVMPQAKTG
jgi:glycosyltransferase involved in cell wall biosynthesis